MYPKWDSYQPRQSYFRKEDTDELHDLFNKKFQFQFNEEWRIPNGGAWFSAPPWATRGLDTLKSRLNFHKSQLNDFNIEEWSSHTRRRNPAGEVCWKIRSSINPEFLTQAWTKFYECAFTYNIVPLEAITDRKMVSLHLCEAPGAFITSLNHYLQTHHPNIKWKWLANTLNPYYEGNSPSNMISDDRFMFHTLNNWDFGVDNTGNLMDWDNSQAIIAKAKSLGQVMLVTADGSIDCLQKPDAQEEVTSPLHYCEIVTALQALSQGGTLIFKLFTVFEHSTVSLLYLINHLFKSVNIYKPVTSRQGNSEVYAVCLGYSGSSPLQAFIPQLQSAYGTELYKNLSLFPLNEIPTDFLKQIEDCASYFCSMQCQVINNNLYAYTVQNIQQHRDMKKIRALVATEFVLRYKLRPLDLEHEILKGILHEECKINTNPRYHRGSYTERQLYTEMTLKEKCNHLNTFLQAEVLSNTVMMLDDQIKWYYNDGDIELKLLFTHGLPLQKVNSSKFIFVPIFKLYQQIMAEEEFKQIILHRSKVDSIIIKDFDKADASEMISFPEHNYLSNYSDFEKKCFKILIEALRKCSEGGTLILDNLNMLTHFNVSVLFILSKTCFKKTGFTSCGQIILNNLVNKPNIKYLEQIESECEKLQSATTKDVLNSLPVQVTNCGDFFSSVVFYNNTIYRNKCAEYLYTLKQCL